jgi:phospholipid-translocating ATPase
MEIIDDCAVDGLRTLLLSKKIIPENIFTEWNKRWTEASQLIFGREEALAVLSAEIEMEMEPVGATAIEDKL